MRFSNDPAGAHDLDGGQLQDIADSVAATYSGQGIPPQFKSSMSNALNVSGIRVEQVVRTARSNAQRSTATRP